MPNQLLSIPQYEIKTINNKFDVVRKFSDTSFLLINTFDSYQDAQFYINAIVFK